MIRRVLELPADAGLPIEMFEPDAAPRLRVTVPPGPEREAAIAEMQEQLAQRASLLGQLAEELLELAAVHDPVQLIPSIAVPASMGLADPSADDDASRSFSWDAKIEYLTGLALAGPPGTRNVNQGVTERAIELLAAVFDSAHAQLFLQSTSETKTDRAGIDAASFLLRLEHLFDRMAGYAEHLEQIADEVFEPHRAFYTSELGFCPSDAVRLVRRHTTWVNKEFNDGREGVFDALESGHPEEKAVKDFIRFHEAMEAAYLWSPSLLADSASLPVEEVRSLLLGVSAEFGCQPAFRTPLHNNVSQRRPLVRLPDDTFLAPTPWSVAHGIHDWMHAYIGQNPHSSVTKRYPKHRSDAAERLVQRSFARVFGEEVVLSNQHYEGKDGHGEVDCLVATSIPIVTEVKSHSLTEKGRKGHRPRIKRVADAVVSASFDQTRRARTYIDEGGRDFAPRQGAELLRHLPDLVGDPVEVVVTLERMDPLATEAGALAGEDHTGRVWVTNLADLLMVCTVLDDPASLLHYAQTRARAHQLGIQMYVESDALGGYLSDRLGALLERAGGSKDKNMRFVLGYSSSEVNCFFTMRELGIEAEPPTTGVPAVLQGALRSCRGYSLTWARVAVAVMAAEPDTWKRWRRFIRRHRGERPFVLANGDAAIVVSPTLKEAELREGEVASLAIPRNHL